MSVKLESDHHNIFTFLQKFSELLGRVLYNIHLISSTCSFQRELRWLWEFLLIKEVFIVNLALRKVPFFNHPVEISLYSLGLWHWSWFFGRSFFSHPVLTCSVTYALRCSCILKLFCNLSLHLKSKYMEMASKILFSNYYHKIYICLQIILPNSQKKTK